MTSATVETFVIGDVDGSKTGDAGEVVWSAYTTSDVVVPSSSSPCTLNGRDFLTFQYITFHAGGGGGVSGITSHSTNITFYKCGFISTVTTTGIVEYTGLADTAGVWVIDSCIFYHGYGLGMNIILPTTGTAADYDADFQIKNCLFIGGAGQQIQITSSGALSNKGGGVDITNCSFFGTGIRWVGTNLSTTIPSVVSNCLIVGAGTGLNAGASGQVTEVQCRISASTARTNVTAGVNSVSGNTFACLVDVGQRLLYGFQIHTPFENYLGPNLGFGDNGGVSPTSDLFGIPRPAGGGVVTTAAATTGTATAGAAGTLTDGGAAWTVNGFSVYYKVKLTGGTGSGQERFIASNTATVLTITPNWSTTPDATSVYEIYLAAKDDAIGAIEKPQTAVQETSIIDGSTSSYKLVGPSVQDVLIPVDAVATTITVRARFDTTYDTTNKPQAIILANAQIGVTTETVTMTAAADTWEHLKFTSQTPTAKGYITVRLVSRPSSGFGIVYFDTFTGGAQGGSQNLDYYRYGEPLPAAVASVNSSPPLLKYLRVI